MSTGDYSSTGVLESEVSECDREASTMRSPWTTRGSCAIQKLHARSDRLVQTDFSSCPFFTCLFLVAIWSTFSFYYSLILTLKYRLYCQKTIRIIIHEGCRMGWPWPILRYNPSFVLEELIKAMNDLICDS